MQYAVGHLLKVGPTGSVRHCFQNFAVNAVVSWSGVNHLFLPFGFSGAVASLKGDNLQASIQLANNDIARPWAKQALDEVWVAQVSVMLFTVGTGTPERLLYDYWGAVSSGGWDYTALNLSLDSILDAVASDIPARKLHRVQVGNLPFTGQIRV
jgi:hypothetical protein